MEFGVLSDIHGNLLALQTVWAALDDAGLTGKERPVLNAGDNVGYGDAPVECIQFLRSHSNIVTVQGNYDRNVARFPERAGEYRRKWGILRPDKFRALKRDSERVSEEDRAWLLDLPRERIVTLNGVDVLITHYAPGMKEGLGPWTTQKRFNELADETEARVVVCGHTHAPFIRMAGDTLFVNPGSTGRHWTSERPYAILTLRPNAPPEARLLSIHD